MKMELLAPVGSKESFITALRGGADAVYAGVPDFNARASAAALSLYDLTVMIDRAHEKGVKVFLALNTLIKHEEINEVVRRLTAIDRLQPDALIVQDPGVASIVRNYFPDLALHASTQMAVHNRMGVDLLAAQGFKRVILARELSFAELRIIAKGSPVPLEVFCHGALCFSISGMCLFSSFIGGLSGNRGRCTQPCRRLWENREKRGYLFSPRDLELAGHIDKLKSIGIACLKIEGRMRSSEYVYRTVRAYRMLIDAPAADLPRALAEAKTILAGDAAREKTTCLFSGRDADLFQPGKAQCLGNRIGTIAAIAGGKIAVEPDAGGEIGLGDYLRLANPATDTTISFKVREFAREGERYLIPFGRAGEFACGNPVFKTIDAAFDQKDIQKEIDAMYGSFKENNPGRREIPQTSQAYTALISNLWKENKRAPRGGAETLWVRFDDSAWLDVLPQPATTTRYVFSLKKENLHQAGDLPDAAVPSLAGELPPFIGQRELPLFKRCIDDLAARGVTGWVLNNISQFEFFKGMPCELTAGQFLYVWNAYTAAFLSSLGVTRFTVSWEDDLMNVIRMCGPGMGRHIVAYLYGFPPLVRSRIITREMLADDVITGRIPAGAEADGRSCAQFLPVFESEQALLIPEKPVSLFNARKKLAEGGINDFGIDLSFMRPDRKRWAEVSGAYARQENPAGSVRFNFKRGVK